jgi:hypothetical protein
MLGAPQSSAQVIKVPKFKLEGDGVFRVPAATNEEMSSTTALGHLIVRRTHAPASITRNLVSNWYPQADYRHVHPPSGHICKRYCLIRQDKLVTIVKGVRRWRAAPPK